MVNIKFSVIPRCIFVLCSYVGLAQTNEFLLKQADAFLLNRQYHRANEIYRKLARVIPADSDFLTRRVNAEFESNHLDSADVILKRIFKMAGGNTGRMYAMHGKLEMAKGYFENAAKFFKLALNSTNADDTFKKYIIDDIKRCGVGESFANVQEQVFLEQVGTDVNSIWDEINPVYSINSDSKFYFNSNREHPGTISNTSGDFELPFDMYSTSLSNGEWSEINALNPDLNSPAHDLLIDFNENGQIVYFKTGKKLNELEFKSDTLSQGKPMRTGSIDNPYILPGDEIFFFTDTFVMISSTRSGGYGGADIYYSARQGKKWLPPVNLGAKINTRFDEVSPYLAYDGRTLIFSSNSTKTMGGFDLFTAFYNDKSMAWSDPQNLGSPINSAGDEKSFRLNKNKLSAIFSSNRKTGIGGYDIYFAYFKNAWVPQSERSNPITFSLVDTSKRTTVPFVAHKSGDEKLVIKVDNIDLIYNSDDQFNQNPFAKKFDEVGEILENNGRLYLIIEVFTDEGNKNRREDHLQTMILAESIKQALINKGIKPSRIWIKGMGSSFPRALEKLNGKENPVGKNLNRHINFTFFSPDPNINKAIRNEASELEIKDIMIDNRYFNYKNSESGLNYKILAISGANASNLEPYITDTDAFFIEKNNSNGRYELMTRGYPDYESSFLVRKNLKANGFEDAVIIPYFANQRLQQVFISKWAELYADLIKYIYRSE